ncbi:CCA tRNA nucleotidyltransferase [Nitratireductor basaltis]|uniref:Polynucleotide adenylyltransferase n=1 Tax=Nitratireductor basaltis TaxID=472175 RepID=A0A084U929_9HYPH|nr:CCA tRNA nucleotidyltransferase [Nitratireductor basaltis]KFB09465.1 Polynucleotide adenylyltransferase [Nitratireductor basaltis]
MTNTTIADAAWLSDKRLQVLLGALNEGEEEARIAGGAVRNTLLGQDVTDIDIATTTTPDETIRRAEAAGFKAIPTGYEHGTITVVADGKPFEVTTLRADVETNGRHAVVAFGRDWQQDANRRDFTINALYADAEGKVYDLVGGLKDLEDRNLRFIGEAEERIREDYLRILRFFRFFAWYGAGRPDAQGLKACARLKDGLGSLSVERVWSELKKLLSAPDPHRAILWMRQTGVLTAIVPETEKWGIDSMVPLVETEKALGWEPQPLLRFAAILPPYPPRIEELAKRLRLSRAETATLSAWAEAPQPSHETSDKDLRQQLYNHPQEAMLMRLRLALVATRQRAMQDAEVLKESAGLQRQIEMAETYQRPVFPLKGEDLLSLGMEPGRQVGEVLRQLEERWVDSDFSLDRSALLESAKAKAGGT